MDSKLAVEHEHDIYISKDLSWSTKASSLSKSPAASIYPEGADSAGHRDSTPNQWERPEEALPVSRSQHP